MFESVLQYIQAKIRTFDYVMTIHADEETDDDGLSILDVEQVILTGYLLNNLGWGVVWRGAAPLQLPLSPAFLRRYLTGQIVERQRDRDSGEWKYLINSQTDDGRNVTVVAKLSPTDTVVIITVYVD